MNHRTRCVVTFALAWVFLFVACVAPVATAEPAAGAREDIRVAVYRDVGVGPSVRQLLTALGTFERVEVREVTAEAIRAGALADVDVLIHPGGSGGKQGRHLGAEGRASIRRYIRDGGGFIGICAGAYLASADYAGSLNVLDARVVDRKHWARGKGTVEIALTDAGRRVLKSDERSLKIFYAQGPLLAPRDRADIPDYETFATFETEIAKNGAPRGVMIGTTAIARGAFGKGRVVCFSPHPEMTEGLESLVRVAIDDVKRRESDGAALPTSTAEAQGVPSQAIVDFAAAFEAQIDAPHGFVLVRHGHVIARGWWKPYAPQYRHILYSLSKSFTSTAIGMLSDAGKLDIDAPVLSFFPDDAPENPSDNLRAMRVRDLLSMNTGHHHDTLGRLDKGDGNWVRGFLAAPVEHRPGTHFRYNSGATYMCSAIVQKITGQTVLEYLTPRLFEPLGIEDPIWENCPRGVNAGGWGLSIRTDDIAKFGQLYLQQGDWNDKQLLSRRWVMVATAPQTPNGTNPESDWNQGYGFQFWRCRHNAYRGDGAFGQFCIVMPEQDAVLAINAGQGNLQRTLNLVYEHLLANMHDGALPADPDAHAALTRKLASLEHAPVDGHANAPVAAKVHGQTYTLEDNPAGLRSVAFHFDGDTRRVTFVNAHGEQRYDLGHGAWQTCRVMFHDLGIPAASTTAMQTVASSCAWTKPNELTARAWLVETPFRFDMTFTFDDDGKTLTLTVSQHPMRGKAGKPIKGTAAE